MRDNLGYGADAEWARARAIDQGKPGSGRPEPRTPPATSPSSPVQNRPETWVGKTSAPPTKDQGPDAPVHSMLASQGWTTPAMPTRTVRAPSELFKTERPENLTRYSYNVSPEEWGLIRQTFENRPGYAPPAKEAAEEGLKNPRQATGYPFSQMSGPLNPAGMAMSPTRMQQVAEKPDTPVLTAPAAQRAELTWETYQLLSKDQKAAVDFNTLLVDAREKDLENVSTPITPEVREKYDRDVAAIFGGGGGSKAFAPETVAMLKQIDFKAVGQDLDDYLALNRTVNLEELERFKKTNATPLNIGQFPSEAAVNVYALQRSDRNLAAIDMQTIMNSAAAIEKVMQGANTVLQDVQSSMAADRGGDVTALGGTPMSIPKVTGYPLAMPGSVQPEMDEQQAGKELFYQGQYRALNDKTVPIETFWEGVSALGMKDEDISELFTYFDTRSRQEERFGRPLELQGGDMRTPLEFRQWIGLGD